VGSLGVHLLPLLLLIAWSGGTPGRIAEAVPVQLVLERAPPEGPAAEAAHDAAPAPAETQAEERPSAHYASTLPPPAPQPSPLPAPRPMSVPAPAHAPRKAVPAKEKAAPQPAPIKRVASNDSTTASAVPPRPRAGPAMMTREQYLAYLAELTWRHVDMLPASFLGTRSGKTVISIKVVRDGTVLGISVAESSGYPDIDARVEQMVAAIGRFPPLPPSIAEAITELRLTLRFPQVLQR
jgi:protein TonB